MGFHSTTVRTDLGEERLILWLNPVALFICKRCSVCVCVCILVTNYLFYQTHLMHLIVINVTKNEYSWVSSLR